MFFAAYNRAVWPAQVVLYCLAAGLVTLALSGRRLGPRMNAIGLGLLWVWTGVAYHWWHFTAINRPVWALGALFLLQGALFAAHGIGGRRLVIGPPHGGRGCIGGLLVAYALVVYPLWGLAAGHPTVEVPVLGVPCPTTIFTFCLLSWAVPPVPRSLLVIPLAWAFFGSTAVLLLGVPQDAGLLVASLLGLLLFRPSAPRSRTVATG